MYMANRGFGLTAHIIDHCKLILKFPEGTNSTWYRNMTTVLKREYLDAWLDGWMDYAAKRIAQTGFGEEIDSHDAVIRDNEALVNKKYAEHVGLKRNFRLGVRGTARNMIPILNGSGKL
ncbi:putative glycosyl transferase family 29, GT29-like superfamiliy [Helianthus annuus]|nr:putative glycosyl transferase family 29, GT29-like superfamiliy [Helianthus annuus]